MSREELVRNLFRQIEKDRIKMISQLTYKLNSIALETKNDKQKIVMMIRIEDLK